jgi:hypothetical protein
MAKNFVKLQPYELTEEQKDAALTFLSEQRGVDNFPRESIRALYIPGPSVRCLSVADYNYQGVIFPYPNKDALDIAGSMSDPYRASDTIIVPLDGMKSLATFIENGYYGSIELSNIFYHALSSETTPGPFVAIVFAGFSLGDNIYSEDGKRVFDNTTFYYAYESPNGLCP